jgi:hypothetical protein
MSDDPPKMTEEEKYNTYVSVRDEAQQEIDKADAQRAWYICDCGAQLQGYQLSEDGKCPKPECGAIGSYQRMT